MQNYRMHPTSYHSHRPVPFAPQPNHFAHDDMSLAMAYVPWQTWCDIYETEKALQHGTIFKKLDLPFSGKGGALR